MINRIIERLNRKAKLSKPCPFCGNKAAFEFRIDVSKEPFSNTGHYAVRHGCCQATGLGETALFFDANVCIGAFKGMCYRIIRNWNKRAYE